ncbi:MAG TPA: hypothetical protein VFW41_08255 [Gaiellaceae bacterium]|nr:hypothetical protein [Gaiellaceae bacterium]
MRAVVAALAAASALGALGATVAHAYLARSAPPALPALHGQVSWAPGVRPAPANVPRGRTAVLVFVARGCTGCLGELRFAIDRLPASMRPVVVRRVVQRDSLVLLVDRRGDIRTGYAFPFAPAFVEGDLRTLAR